MTYPDSFGWLIRPTLRVPNSGARRGANTTARLSVSMSLRWFCCPCEPNSNCRSALFTDRIRSVRADSKLSSRHTRSGTKSLINVIGCVDKPELCTILTVLSFVVFDPSALDRVPFEWADMHPLRSVSHSSVLESELPQPGYLVATDDSRW